MPRSHRGRTFSSGYDDDAYTRDDYADDGDSISTGYTNMTGRTGTSRTGVTTGPSGFVRLNKLVLFWTSAMTLTVLTILSYFTMALISLGAGGDDGDGDQRRRLYLEDRYLAGDDAAAGDDAYAGDDAAAAAGDDAYAGGDAGDDAAAGDDGAQNDDAYAGDDANAKQNWGEDNYEMGDDDQAYGVVDDAIATDDDAADGSRFGAFGSLDGFDFALSPQEAIYLILVFVAVVGLDYYGLEAIKELGNKAARFRVGAFAAFVLFLGNSTAAAALMLGISKNDSTVGGGIAGTSVNAVSVLFVLLSVLYIGFGLTLYMSERSPLVSTTRREPLLEESKRSTNDRLFMFWVALVIIVTLLLVSVFGIDRAAQNAANHQTHYKLNTCVVWSTAAWVIITVIGMLTLKARGYSTKLLTGTFYGCLVGFSVLSLVFTVYFVGAVSIYRKEESTQSHAAKNVGCSKRVAFSVFVSQHYIFLALPIFLIK